MIVLCGRINQDQLKISKPSATTVNVAERVFQPLIDTGVCILPSMQIDLLEKVLSFGFAFWQSQIASELLSTTHDAFDWLRMLHALPELT